MAIDAKLAAEWHPTRNGTLMPKDLTSGSGKRAWWQCTRGHEWQAVIGDRSRGRGCPYCSGKAVNTENCLSTVNPASASEWHPTRNGNLTPEDVTAHSNKEVWWRCKRGHEWKASVNSRSRGTGCPYCAGKAVNEENCLATFNASLAAEWHPTRNGSLTSQDVTSGSGKRVWWQCERGHEWKASVSNRTNGTSCPYCAGKAVNTENCLSTVNPASASEWHPTRNGNLTPEDVTPHSNRVVWWQCERGHEWKTSVSNRTNGTSCPYCAGKAVNEENCLATVNASLAAEWHPTRNDSLTAADVTQYSHKQVWWQCKKGHEWKAAIGDRNGGHGCPYCSGRYATAENCLGTANSALAAEWHPTRNGSLTSQDVTSGSGKRVWWQCEKGHEWKAAVNSRSRGTGCPYCAGTAVNEENCLATVNASLAAEWHPTRNGSLTSQDVTSGSGKRVWWQCEKGHEWKAAVSHRSGGQGCPFCSGRAVNEENCLGTVNPALAAEWHPTRNGGLTPQDVTSGSERRVWWRCKRGHEWRATISHRSSGTACPYCHSATSQMELALLCEMKCLFEHVQHRCKVYGQECDVYLPDFGVGFELDALYWHKDRYERDKAKHDFLSAKGVTLLNVRENGLKEISNTDVLFSSKDTPFALISRVVSRLLEIADLNQSETETCRAYLDRGTLVNLAEYDRLLHMLPSPILEASLQGQHTSLASQWHPTRNGSLTPEDVTPHSNKVVWWQCERGHEWKTSVNNRSNGTGCPYCAGKAVNEENCLSTVNPTLAAEWHPTRNDSLTAADVTQYSHKQVWWQCKKGHEWKAAIGDRNGGHGCPYCSGRYATAENCLDSASPVLASEWHPTRNGNLTPEDVTAHSNKEVWWRCKRGHEWKASVNSRSRGTGCPYCAGKAVNEENCLSTVNPTLAAEWHPTRNDSLTAADVTQYSDKQVWWQCKKGHEWKASVSDRSRGRGCPYCAGKAVNEENCLATVNASLAAEWHPTRNDSLTAADVTQYSHKQVWWQCKKGHEWKAAIAHRSGGTGCPYCAGRRRPVP